MTLIRYVGPYDSVDVTHPLHRFRAERGVPVEVPDDVAGRESGPWQRVPDGEGAPAGWPTRVLVDEQGSPVFGDNGLPGSETQDPGEGLLAQECWELAPPAAAPSRRAGATAPADPVTVA